MATASPTFTGSNRALSRMVWTLIAGLVVLAAWVMGSMPLEIQSYVAFAGLTLVAGSLILPVAWRKDRTISLKVLFLALAVFIIGALIRFLVTQMFYGGVSDARGYFTNGVSLAEDFRVGNYSALIPPYTDTNEINYAAGFLYTLIPPSMLAGFVVFAGMAFIGSWHFYKAFRVSFPDGDRRLYAIFIFFLPSFWYWTTSLGKDAPMLMGLGVATYGFALMFRKLSAKAVAYVVVGLGVVSMVRSPLAAALAVAGVAAFALRPTRARTSHVQALAYLLLIPILALGALTLIAKGRQFVGATEGTSIQSVVAQAQQQDFDSDEGSNFSPASPFTPQGLALALITANFRPFPWEAGGLLPALQSLEGVGILMLFLLKFRAIGRVLRAWRRNAMTIMVLLSTVFISIVLTSLANFGLLARQRTQVLPFLLMIPCMMVVQSLRPGPKPEEEQADRPVPAWA